MTRLAALLDANILYPAPMRDIFLQLAVDDAFRARWTADIHREWIDALLRNEPLRDRAVLERTRDLMDLATRDALVTGYETLIPALDLPDPDDRHVLAAAIIGRCDMIVTRNLRDFPDASVAPYGIEVRHPDEFLSDRLHLAPRVFCESVRKVRARLVAPSITVEEYLGGYPLDIRLDRPHIPCRIGDDHEARHSPPVLPEIPDRRSVLGAPV